MNTIEKCNSEGTEEGSKKKLVFITIRESWFTELFKTKQGLALYRMCLITLILFVAISLILALATKGKVVLAFALFQFGFGKLQLALINWSIFLVFTCLVFCIVKIWSYVLHQAQTQSTKKLWNYIFIFLFALYTIAYFTCYCRIGFISHFPPFTALLFYVDGLRLYLKSYAFVRSSIPILEDEEKMRGRIFGNYLYFLFAPTLLYADQYPRTKCVNWKSALWHLAEFLGSFFFLCYLWDTLIISQFPPAAFENFSIENFALSFAYYPVIGLTGAYTMGFAYLHALQNFFAEILRYGDRVFHEDYWCAHGFRKFHKNWNRPVYNFVYNYVFIDLRKVIKSPLVARLIVFFISSVLHELVLSFMVRSFLPVFGIMFFVSGFLFYDTNDKYGHYMVLYTIQMSMGVCVFLYTLEYYAIAYCPKSTSEFRLLPTIFRCS